MNEVELSYYKTPSVRILRAGGWEWPGRAFIQFSFCVDLDLVQGKEIHVLTNLTQIPTQE